MQKLNSVLYNKQVKEIAQKGEALFKDLPHLPKNWVLNIVKALPILVLIFGVASVFSGIESLFAFNLFIDWMGIRKAYYYVNAAFAVLMGALYLLSYKLIKNKEYEGWLLLFWTAILAVVQSLVLLILGWGSPWGFLLSAAISFYLLYEIRAEFISPKITKVSESKKSKK